MATESLATIFIFGPQLLSYLLALILTIVIEIIVAFILKYRDKLSIGAIVIVNIMTHPAANLLNILLLGILGSWPSIIILEILVIIVEWRLLVYALNKDGKSLLKLSIIMNLVTFVLGLLFFFKATRIF